MPATDYSKTIIYVIKCRDDNITEEYVGSTTNFRSRKSDHKTNSNNGTRSRYNLKIYQFIRANGGWDNFIMIQLEEFPCKNRREAEKREEEVRVERKAQLNSHRAFATEDDKKDQQKIWRRENKEKINKQQKQRRAENKDEKIKKERQYYQNNKDKINERQKIYNQKYKEKYNEIRKEYREKNRDKLNERRRQKRAEKKQQLTTQVD